MGAIKIILEQASPTSMRLVNDFQIVVDRPAEKGGGGTGLMGGQYLLTGIAGCFCSTLFAAAQARQILIENLKVVLEANLSQDLPKRFDAVQLHVSYGSCNQPDEFGPLLKIAEKGCLSINTIKKGMDFRIVDHE